MPAYLIANYTVTDPAGYADYPSSVAPTLGAYGGELLVGDFSSERIEGDPAPVSVVVKFPDKQAAHSWYNSDAYQAVIGLRTANAEGFVLFADGIA